MSKDTQLEFKPRISSMWYVAFACLLGFFALCTVVVVTVLACYCYKVIGAISTTTTAAGLGPELQEARCAVVLSLLAATFLAAVTIYLAFEVRKHILEMRRGAIVLDAHGIEITNWRGQQKDIPWARLQQVRVVTCGGLFQPRPLISIKADWHTEKISAYIPIEARARLLEEIISRAGLRESHHSWFVTQYTV